MANRPFGSLVASFLVSAFVTEPARAETPRLYRVILPAAEMESSVRFYRDLLSDPGRRVSPGRHYFDSGEVILAIVNPRADGDERAVQPNQDYVYFAVQDLEGERTDPEPHPPPILRHDRVEAHGPQVAPRSVILGPLPQRGELWFDHHSTSGLCQATAQCATPSGRGSRDRPIAQPGASLAGNESFDASPTTSTRSTAAIARRRSPRTAFRTTASLCCSSLAP